MGWFDKIFGGGELKESSKSVQEVAPHIQAGGKLATQKATDLVNSGGYQAYDGQRVAGFNPDQQSYFDAIRDYVGSGKPDVTAESLQGARDYAAAPAQEISTSRIVDTDRTGGDYKDYLNPYVDNVWKTVQRELEEAYGKQQKTIDNRARLATSGEGDAQERIAQDEAFQSYMQRLGDTGNQFFRQATDDALNRRAADEARFVNVDAQNAGLEEQALDRLLRGTGDLETRSAQSQETLLKALSALFGSGSAQQANEQAGLDAAYQEYGKEYQGEYDALDALLRTLGQPSNRTTTTYAPDAGVMGVVGPILGAMAGNKMKPSSLAPGGSGGGG